jgi:hypothetical protein
MHGSMDEWVGYMDRWIDEYENGRMDGLDIERR